jgi:hypothetical protein
MCIRNLFELNTIFQKQGFKGRFDDVVEENLFVTPSFPSNKRCLAGRERGYWAAGGGGGGERKAHTQPCRT